MVRYRKMEWFNEEEQAWEPVATIAEGADGSLAYFYGSRPVLGPHKPLDHVEVGDIPCSLPPTELRMGPVLEHAGRASNGHQALDLVLWRRCRP